jgi:hypothetical protein
MLSKNCTHLIYTTMHDDNYKSIKLSGVFKVYLSKLDDECMPF